MSSYVYLNEPLREKLAKTPVVALAPQMLGMIIETDQCRVQIVEVEAYNGEVDPGSHAWRGPTPRTQVMYGKAGYSYVYFAYGNHWMLNVVTGPVGWASAVLIRAAEPLAGEDIMFARRPKAKTRRDLLSGPGKLAAALGLTGEHSGVDLLDPASPVRLQEGQPALSVLSGTRIGLSAGRGEHLPWRFIDAGRLEWVSRPIPRR